MIRFLHRTKIISRISLRFGGEFIKSKFKAAGEEYDKKHEIREDFEKNQAGIKLQMPRNPDDDPELEPHEQDESYGRTTTTLLSSVPTHF